MMTPYELTPSDEISRRIKRLQEEMAKKEIDLALVIQNVDLFYFSGSIQRGYLFVPSEGEAVFFVEKNYQRAVGETPLKCIQTPSLKALPNLIGEHGFHGSSVGMEFDVIPVAMFNRLKTFFKHWETVDLSREIKKIRSVKSEFEISQIKKAGRIVTQVFSEVKNHLREGVTELELDGILTSIGRALGHQGLLRMRGFNHEMMNIHVLSGTSGSVVSYSDTPLAGHIYERMQEIAEKEGLASNFMGYGQGKVSFVGHGLGFEINEWPILSKGKKRPLQSGMVFAFEPKFVFPNEGAVGIEVDFIVRGQGLERVTESPKDVVYL